jgi:hypothetical protein
MAAFFHGILFMVGKCAESRGYYSRKDTDSRVWHCLINVIMKEADSRDAGGFAAGSGME